ncbi:MAG: hypothetical protein VW771_00260 [Gammaproteobacteria bacterium]
MRRYVVLLSLLVAPLIAKGSTWIRWSCGDDYWVDYIQGCCSVLNPESVNVQRGESTVALDPAGKDWVSDATKTPVYKFIANKNAVGRYHYTLLVEENGVTTEITCERLF